MAVKAVKAVRVKGVEVVRVTAGVVEDIIKSIFDFYDF